MSIKSIERVLKNRAILMDMAEKEYPGLAQVLSNEHGAPERDVQSELLAAVLVLAAIVEDLSDVIQAIGDKE